MILVIIYMCNISFGTSLFLFSVSLAGAELFLVDLGYRGLRGQVLVAQRNAPQEQAMLAPEVFFFNGRFLRFRSFWKVRC